MRKKFGLLLSVCVVLVMITGCVNSDTTKSDPYNSYKKVTYGTSFECKIPKGWEFDDSNADYWSYYQNSEDHADGMLNLMSIDDVQGSVTEEQAFESFISGIKQADGYDGGLEISDVDISGSPAKQYCYKITIDDNTYYINNVVFDCTYGWGSIGIMTKNKNEYADTFNNIVDSITVLDSTTEEPTTEEPTTEEATTEATTTEQQATTGEEQSNDSYQDWDIDEDGAYVYAQMAIEEYYPNAKFPFDPSSANVISTGSRVKIEGDVKRTKDLSYEKFYVILTYDDPEGNSYKINSVQIGDERLK
ncbi:MAG: hypothetical protein PHT76_14915 [Anaerostipes sp.]|nr:hypothetical protein [Anaerostipes sp.]